MARKPNDNFDAVTVLDRCDRIMRTVKGNVRYLDWCHDEARRIGQIPGREARVFTKLVGNVEWCCVEATGCVDWIEKRRLYSGK